ncbi:MAG: hypothetical protein IKG42_04775 [Clostridia bacterium]|nr:hypothetical protein [Clostridia bacterium]
MKRKNEENKCKEIFISNYENVKRENEILRECFSKIYSEAFRVNQYGSIENLKNKIKMILADCETKLIS